MQQENKKWLKILFWILTVLCMAGIFYFSSRTADESSQQSLSLLKIFTKIFGDNVFTDFIVRKCAHCFEYTVLCILLNCALYFSRGKKSVLIAISFTSLYAVTDEIHQLFVTGRSCELRDWAIDTGGAIIGAIIFLAIFYIINLIFKQINKKTN